MIAHLYIVAESFQNNAGFTNIEIEGKIKRLSEDIVLINRYKDTNKLYANFERIYPQLFYSTFTVFDFICNTSVVKNHLIDRDVLNYFQKIFDRATNTTISTKEVKNELLNWNDKNNCHGLIAFNKVDGVDDSIQLIYGRDNWFKFRRHFLGIYPKNSDFFIDECVKYFPKVFFHEQNRKSIVAILNDFSVSILKHLGFLNDVFYDYRNRYFINETIKYQTFTTECSLEEDAASKDVNSSKDQLTFRCVRHGYKL